MALEAESDVRTERERTGGEIVVDYLIAEGVEYVFGVPGHGSLGLTDAFLKRKDEITVVQMKQEMSGVHMAIGYYRVTGKPCAVFTSIGPGAINTAIGLADAYVDSMPVLVLTGDTHVHMRGVGVLQEIERHRDSDFPRILEPIVKRSFQPAAVEQLPRMMQRAFNYMLTGRRGPVHIDLPMDVQCDSVRCALPKPVSHRVRSERVIPDPTIVEEAVEMIVEAQRPVIVAGGGVITSDATVELRLFAELIDAAVVGTMMGKDAFPNDHPLFGWATGSKGTSCGVKLTREADLVIALGCRFADETTCSYKKGAAFDFPDQKLIHVDIDPHEIGKNYPADVGILGDVRETLEKFIGRLNARCGLKEDRDAFKKPDYRATIAEYKNEWFDLLAKHRRPEREPVMISCLLDELRAALPREAVIVTSSGNTQAQMLEEIAFYEPHTCLSAGGFSTMGYTVPAAIGAKLADPDRVVCGLVGDGDFMMTMQELATAMQLDIPVLVVLANNMGWIAIKDLQQDVYGEERAYATEWLDANGEIYTPDFATIAGAFGCHTEQVSKAGEVKPAIERALATGKPAVVEVIVDRTFGTSGSPAWGWWDVPVPTYLEERRAKYEKERAGEDL